MEPRFYDQIAALLENCETELLKLDCGGEEWEVIYSKKGIKGESIHHETGYTAIRAVGVINCRVDAVTALLWDMDNKNKWNKETEKCEILATIDERTKIIHETTCFPWPMSNRDFVYAVKLLEKDYGNLILYKSIWLDCNICQPIEGYIRGDIIVAGFIIKKLEGDRTELTYLISGDPRGLIPDFAVSKSGSKVASNINRIRKILD